jgi:hypothetical protein
MAPRESRRYPLLGLVAYALVPGERRVRAGRHFRHAGVEVLRGVGAFLTPERRADTEASERERIQIY